MWKSTASKLLQHDTKHLLLKVEFTLTCFWIVLKSSGYLTRRLRGTSTTKLTSTNHSIQMPTHKQTLIFISPVHVGKRQQYMP